MTILSQRVMAGVLIVLLGLGMAACNGGQGDPLAQTPADALAGGERLQVVATTTLVADVVKQVGGDLVDLATLLPIGADPHGYSPTPQDLRAVAGADVIFVNGLGLEVFLDEMLVNAGGDPAIVSVSDGIETLTLDATLDPMADEDHGDEHDHDGIDPHVWFSVGNVQVWTANVARSLAELDPAHAADYAQAGESYNAQLVDLDQELRDLVAELGPDQRKIVSDHRSFGYLAQDYDFETVGAVVNSFSTVAQPSAQELAALQDQIAAVGVKAIFVGFTANNSLTTQLSKDLDIQVVSLFTGSLSPADGPAATYLDFMRYNVEAIVNALK